MRLPILSFAAGVLTLGSAAAAENPAFSVHPRAGEILEQYCYDCHDEDTQKGDIRLDNLGELPLSTRPIPKL